MFKHRHVLRALWELTIREWRRTPQEPDIDRLLIQAQNELERQYAGNREQAIRAITQKNNVLQLAHNLKYQRDRCEDIAIEAEDNGNDYIANRYRYRQAAYQEALDSVQDAVEETQKAGLALHTHLTMEELEVEARTTRLRVLKDEWQTVGATAEMGRQIQAEVRYLVDETYNHYSLKAVRDIVGWLLLIIAVLVLTLLLVVLH
ncbi:MAG: hypothetical protein QM758_03560 [Armatimonas sp.]